MGTQRRVPMQSRFEFLPKTLTHEMMTMTVLIFRGRKINGRAHDQATQARISRLRPPIPARIVSFFLDKEHAERLASQAGFVPISPSEYARRLVEHCLDVDASQDAKFGRPLPMLRAEESPR
jgi:hypothetical protein